MYPLSFNVDPNSWRLFCLRKADSAFRKFQETVFSRDDNTCQYCGFKTKKYLDVVNLDANYNNNKLSNMLTACCFCFKCHFLGKTDDDQKTGVLIHLPDINQNDVNSLCHVLFSAIAKNAGLKPSAMTIYRNFKNRSKSVDDKFGEGVNDPKSFRKMILESDIDLENIREDLFREIRLLPLRSSFSEQTAFWENEQLQDLAEVK